MATATELDDRVSAMLEFAIAANPDLRQHIDFQNERNGHNNGTQSESRPPAEIVAASETISLDTLDTLLEAIAMKKWIDSDWQSPYPCYNYECGYKGTIGEMCTIGVHDIINFKDLKSFIVCKKCGLVLTKRKKIPICTDGSDIYPLIKTIFHRVNRLSAFRAQL